ncbi:MAG TPA: RNase adapter RapZ [Steroidobacteraceae bacterium]|nr:RNase adapter RapZ [Steroidobacteraceae bacterium]
MTEHTPVRIVILSGLSGSGKSVALHMLEDLGFYCIDNIPAALLTPFISFTVRSPETTYERTAIGLDARNTAAEIASVPQLIDELKRSGLQVEVIFLIAGEDELLRRFAETRRRHPLSAANVDLREAMALERRLLEPVASAADLLIDTSRMGVHALREVIHQRVEQRAAERLSITFESFGFKDGIPGDADFVFDARALPNPYWEPGLRNLTGRDAEVVRFLETHTDVARLVADIARFMRARLPEYQASNRGYLTVAVGCTGGQHRSVYIVDRLAEDFGAEFPNVTARHSALPDSGMFRVRALQMSETPTPA